MINVLPPISQLELAKMPAPTGYQSKINFLKKLREIVAQQVRRINTEDRLFQKLSHHRLRSIALRATSGSSSSSSSSGSSGSNLTDLSEIASELRLDMKLDPALENAIAASLDMGHITTSDIDEKGNENYDGNNQPQKHKKSGSGGSVKSVKFKMFEPETGNDANGLGVTVFGGSIEDIVRTIPEDEDLAALDDAEVEKQYNHLLQRKKSRLGVSQRKLLTMHSVNKLSTLIDGISLTKQTEQ